MSDFLQIAARCYDVNGRVESLHPLLRHFLVSTHEMIVRANSGPHAITEPGLRSSQVVALACQTWEAMNPCFRAYTP